MMRKITFSGFCILSVILSSCAPVSQQPTTGERHIVAHPQYTFNDRVDGIGWLAGSTINMEIDDPANGEGVDYSDSQSVPESGEAMTMVSFFTGEAWDLQPGHIITLSDGETTVRHVVQDLGIDSFDIEADTFSGWAAPGSEVMVWVEAPYEHELRVTVDGNGHWFADLTDITDIIPSSIGAVAQNDDPNSSSHTRINWSFDMFHIEASLTDD